MSTSAIPDVIDALVTLSTAAQPDVNVFDGVGNSDDWGDYLMVGVDDVSSDGDTAAESSQEAATLGTARSRQEEGTVTCLAESSNGDGDQKAARDGAFAIANKVADLCRANPNLGLTDYMLLVADYGTDQRLMQGQNEQGAIAYLIFSVRFRARL